MPDKIVYDVIQGFEVENGVPHLISTNIQVIESGSDLFSFAQEWLIKNTKLASFNKQQYIEYKPSKKAKRYDLVLASRVTSLQLSFPIEKIKDPKQKMELESPISPDPVFPYLHRNSK